MKKNNYFESFRLLNLIDDDEELLGGFAAQDALPWIWMYFIGVFIVFLLNRYQVVVTNKRVFLCKLFFNRISKIEDFKYEEIHKVWIKRGFCHYKISLRFWGDRFRELEANRWNSASIENWKFDEKMKLLLESKII